MNKLIFKLSENELIQITADNNIDIEKIDYCCDDVNAYFLSNNEEQLYIGQDSAGLLFEAFIGVLKKAIDGKLQLDESLTQDLGLMANEYFRDLSRENPKFVKVSTPDGSSRYWIGLNYEIWDVSGGADHYVNTWLYNDHNNNIIFKVTKLYKWSFREDEPEDPSFIIYDEFMKDYKPLIHRIIPRDVAIQWLEQAMKIHRGFFSTEENYQNLCKMLKW